MSVSQRHEGDVVKTAFVYSEEVAGFTYGPSHPLKPIRLRLTYELIKAYGLLSLPSTLLVQAEKATDEDLLLFHDREYIDILRAANEGLDTPRARSYGLGPGDNPVFKGLYDWSVLVAGASLQAARLVDSGEADCAFNIAGGLHHAHPARASGFCYINDPVLAITWLLKQGRRIAYIDIDAHHGDGVQYAFYHTDRVLTISLHESGHTLFPGSGFENEAGQGKGFGYSVNVPLPLYADDEIFVYAFDSVVTPMIERFKPDVVVTQLGVDSFRSDPLAHLQYTTKGFCEVVGKLRDLSPKWIALGGGGYDITNVARAWTLAWALMNGVDLPDMIPEEFLRQFARYGFDRPGLRDEIFVEGGSLKAQMRREVEGVVRYIQGTLLPEVTQT